MLNVTFVNFVGLLAANPYIPVYGYKRTEPLPVALRNGRRSMPGRRAATQGAHMIPPDTAIKSNKTALPILPAKEQEAQNILLGAGLPEPLFSSVDKGSEEGTCTFATQRRAIMIGRPPSHGHWSTILLTELGPAASGGLRSLPPMLPGAIPADGDLGASQRRSRRRTLQCGAHCAD